MEPRKNLRIALVLGAASGAAVPPLFPYLLEIEPKLATMKVGVPVLIAAQTAQLALMAFALGWLGLRLGAGLGLDAPYLRAWLYKTRSPIGARWARAAVTGIVIGAVMVAMDKYLFMPHLPEVFHSSGYSGMRWKGLLASPYGGIAEEVLTRLFLMTLIAWIASKALRGTSIYVVAIAISAIGFAAGHLPAAAAMAPLSTWIVVRALVVNSVGGLVFGWVFWKKGLEHSMLAHFCADLMLHVIAP